MKIRSSLIAAALASSLAAPLAVHAANFSVDVDVAPPAPPVYAPLPPREGYVVAPGYYRFDADAHKHVWVDPAYERARQGEHYVGSEWKEDHGRYHFNEGHWDRD